MVGVSDGERVRGSRVGASEPEPEPGTSVGASDGGGISDEELPVPLDGVRTAAPPSAGERASRSRRGLPCSVMGDPIVGNYDRGKGNLSRREGRSKAAAPPGSRLREFKKYIPPCGDCQRIWRFFKVFNYALKRPAASRFQTISFNLSTAPNHLRHFCRLTGAFTFLHHCNLEGSNKKCIWVG